MKSVLYKSHFSETHEKVHKECFDAKVEFFSQNTLTKHIFNYITLIFSQAFKVLIWKYSEA